MNRSCIAWILVALLSGIAIQGCESNDASADASASRDGAAGGNGGADSGEADPMDGGALDSGRADADGLWADDAGLPDAAAADAGDDPSPVVQLQPVEFTACDLRAVDWEEVLPEEEISCEEEPEENCQYWTPWLGSVTYADTDDDGIEEAWVVWHADVTSDFGLGAMESYASVYVRDTACAVRMANLFGDLDWVTLTPVEGGADLVIEGAGGERHESYRWVEGGLQLQTTPGGEGTACATAPDISLGSPEFTCDPVPGTWTLEVVYFEGSSPLSRLYCGLGDDAVPNDQGAFDMLLPERAEPDEIVTSNKDFVRAESCASGSAIVAYEYAEDEQYDRLLIWRFEN